MMLVSRVDPSVELVDNVDSVRGSTKPYASLMNAPLKEIRI